METGQGKEVRNIGRNIGIIGAPLQCPEGLGPAAFPDGPFRPADVQFRGNGIAGTIIRQGGVP
jgi:hypothetical protein